MTDTTQAALQVGCADKLEDLTEHAQRQCNFYVNGICMTRKCLVRGGYDGQPNLGPDFYDRATCPEKETAIALIELARLREERAEMLAVLVAILPLAERQLFNSPYHPDNAKIQTARDLIGASIFRAKGRQP